MPENATQFSKLRVGDRFWDWRVGEGPTFVKMTSNKAILVNSVMQRYVKPIYMDPRAVCIPAA